MKHFLSVTDIGDISTAIAEALMYKLNPLQDIQLGNGKTFGMIFMNPSLRTRLSSQIAAEKLGMRTSVLNIDKDAWNLEFKEGAVMNENKVEHIIEAAGVLGQFVDILGVRSFSSLQNKADDDAEIVIKKFQQYAQLPIVSLEAATLHPLQSFADMITIHEHWQQPKKPKVVMTWAPHIKALPQAVPNSFAQWINAWQTCDFVVTHPEGYELDQKITGALNIEYDQNKALEGADFVYVKNWSATKDYGKILCQDKNWMIDNKKIALGNKAKIMHCLPVRRNVVIADEVLDGPQSIVLQQAKNRICSAQVVLSRLLKTLA